MHRTDPRTIKLLDYIKQLDVVRSHGLEANANARWVG